MCIKNILSIPTVYSSFQKMIVKDFNKLFYQPFLKVQENNTILDIGCGPADVLDYLPSSVQYHGFDLSEDYIKKAQDKYTGRNAVFKAETVSNTNLPEELRANCDIVMAIGVIHHLDDQEVSQLYSLAKLALKNGGRLITIDPCFVDKQNSIARFMVSNDRGQYVRNIDKYRELAIKHLGNSTVIKNVNNLLRIPYNHIIIEWTKGEE